MPIQMNAPDAALGDGTGDGRTAKYGASRYANGNSKRKSRNESKVPRRAWTGGYKNSWRSMPRTPEIDVARPTVAAGMPRPPLNENGSEWRVDAESGRGVDRKRDQRFANALC